MWAQELVDALKLVDTQLSDLPMRGIKGTTGTQATYLQLFEGNHEKVEALDKLVCEKLGFAKRFPITGQTYPRGRDYAILSSLASVAIAAKKMCSDLRILAHDKEMEEGTRKEQVGSTAMAYKKNPMQCERACSIARHVMALAQESGIAAAEQGFERTLDDSAGRRMYIPEAFLGIDSVLILLEGIVKNLQIWPAVIERRVNAELPFLATELIIMESVGDGESSQEIHEALRELSNIAGARVKAEGLPNNLLDLIKTDMCFSQTLKDKLENMARNPANFVGRAPEQAKQYCAEVLDPLLKELTVSNRIVATVRV